MPNKITPVKLFQDQEPLKCEYCGKDLFKDPEMSIVVFVEDSQTDEIVDIFTCCKGNCDKTLQKIREGRDKIDGWKDLTDFLNPTLYLKHLMAVMNNIYDGKKINKKAFEKYKNVLISTAPFVMRQPTDKELNNAINDTEYF